MKNKFIAFVALVISLFLCYHFWTAVNFDNIKYVKIAGQEVRVDLALTTEEHNKGLSGRSGLKENEGMLFVFDKPDKYSFWMKDMKFLIDMIWLNEDLKVIYIKSNALPISYPTSYGPDVSEGFAKYVLEVSAGFADKNNLKVGDGVLFTY